LQGESEGEKIDLALEISRQSAQDGNVSRTNSKILDGKSLSKQIEVEIRCRVETHMEKGRRPPGLAVVLVGDNQASKVYVANKEKFAHRCCVHTVQRTLSKDCSKDQLADTLHDLNSDEQVDGILLQLPLPRQFDSEDFIELIDPDKDADGLTAISQGRLIKGLPGARPCTPSGVMLLLKEAMGQDDFTLAGKRAAVVGRSILVGKPIALLLTEKDATVTIAHSKSTGLQEICREADIVVAAVGVPELVKGDWIKEGAIVLDVGINRLASGILSGDVEFKSAVRRAAAITPVPGGVGPMTVAMLLWNTLWLYERRLERT
jgi:methylenetetrahydrofolate dehydrogenase (NADP+) / methenyltetrahydrofolate cyclohydrolase